MWAAAIAVGLVWLCFRSAFIADCRLAGRDPMICWQTEPLIPVPKGKDGKADGWAGLLAIGAGFGWLFGFNTYNPNLTGRSPTDDKP